MEKTLVRQTSKAADKAAERDRASTVILEQQRAQMVQKTARLRELRLARDAQAPVADDKKPKSVAQPLKVLKADR